MMAVRQAQGGPRDPYSPLPQPEQGLLVSRTPYQGSQESLRSGAPSSHPLLPSAGPQRKQDTSDKTGLQVAATVHRRP